MQKASLGVLLVSATCISGCQGVVWGNMAVLAMSVGIFLGTLALGRGR